MEASLFKKLNTSEEQEFRKWARDNFKPGDEISPIWHPILRDECFIIEKESDAAISCRSKI